MSGNIKCKWIETGRIVINPDGQVAPCCYFANSLYVAKGFKHARDGDVYHKYNKAYNELNAFNNPIDKIINHQWFDDLYESWNDSNTTHRTCKRYCSVDK